MNLRSAFRTWAQADDVLKTGRLSRRQVMAMFAASAMAGACGDDASNPGGGSADGGGGPIGGSGGGPEQTGGFADGGGGGGGGVVGVGGSGGGDPLASCKLRGPTDGCAVTEDNILGPFYKAGAPFDSDLADQLAGDRMVISGTVYGCDCETPLAGAIVDIWQADSEGAYDSVGFTLRGRLVTDELGRYSFTTVKPGWYLNGAQYRPAHIHYKVSHRNGIALTTQLYFEGDPYIDIDPFVKESLIIPLNSGTAGGQPALLGTFDIALA